MKLIDKDKIAAKIEKRRKSNSKNKLNLPAAFEDNYLLSFLDTLETKEVDLEKEIDKWICDYAITHDDCSITDVISTAKYFFELGLKAQKRE